MRLNQAVIVLKREYLTRVKTRGFWLATAVLPLFMGALIAGPTLASRTKAEQRLAIVDSTGTGLGQDLIAALPAKGNAGQEAPQGQPSQLGQRRGGQGTVTFVAQLVAPGANPAATRLDLDRRVRSKAIGAWVWISPEGLKENSFEYHSDSVSNVLTLEVLKGRISEVVNRWRLRAAGLDPAKIAELTRPLDLQTVRISATGSRAEKGVAGFTLAFGLCFLLYMLILIYGTQVMQGVIEEKSSRVIEVVTAAVRPTELMAGKLVGICLVALTQLAIWTAAAVVLTLPGLLGALIAMPEGLIAGPVVIVHLFLLFLIGFFLYSTLYAMIGAAFNSVQEAQQFAGVVVVFIVPPLLFLLPIINDPDSTMAVGMSMFPFFTPLVMMLRIASKMPPAWQIVAAYLICLGTIAGMIWLCARIYRVGILMYGKKPTLQEIVRWVRYS